MMLFLQLGALTLCILLACYGVGAVLLKWAGVSVREQHLALFLSLVTGLGVLVCCYAIYCTKGATSMLPVLVLLGVLLWLLRQPPPTELPAAASQTIQSGVRLLLGLGAFIFLSRYLLLFDSSSEFLRTPFQDYVFYGRLTMPLNRAGIETNSLEAVYPQFLGPHPYHYFEIWLNALLVRLTSLPAAWCMFLATASVLITVVGVGFAAIFAHFRLRRGWLVVLAVLFLTVTGTVWPFLQHISLIRNGALLASLLLPLQPKLAPVYLFMLLGTSLLLSRQYVAAAVTLAIVPLVFVPTAPVVGGGLLGLALYLWRARQISGKQAAAMVVPVVCACVYIGLFYLAQPRPFDFPGTGWVVVLQSAVPQIGEIKTLINITVGVFINFSVYFLGYGLLLVAVSLLQRQGLTILKEQRIILVWFVASLLVAAVMWALGSHFLDGFQFFSNPIVPLTPIVLAVLLGACLRKASLPAYGLSVAVLVLLLVVNSYRLLTHQHPGHVTTRYSPQFLRQMAQVLPSLGARGGYILADEEYEGPYTLSSNSYTAGTYVSNFKNDYALISLSALDPDSLTTDPRFARDSTQAAQIVRESTLFRFAKFQALRHQASSPDNLKYELVRRAGLAFICVSRRGQLPTILQPLVEKSYQDSYSGEKLYVLRGSPVRQLANPYIQPLR